MAKDHIRQQNVKTIIVLYSKAHHWGIPIQPKQCTYIRRFIKDVNIKETVKCNKGLGGDVGKIRVISPYPFKIFPS